jgi:hypothetical protein
MLVTIPAFTGSAELTKTIGIVALMAAPYICPIAAKIALIENGSLCASSDSRRQRELPLHASSTIARRA